MKYAVTSSIFKSSEAKLVKKALLIWESAVLCINQTEECATKRVFGVIISHDNVVGKRLLDILAGLTIFSLVTGFSYILIIVLLHYYRN